MSIHQALINYAKVKRELEHINKKISEQMELSFQNLSEELKAVAGYEDCYWLKLAYAMEDDPSDCGYGYQRVFSNHDDDVEGFLAENCQYALAAHRLIQERKKIKKRFGIAKAVISRMATKFLSESEISE